MVDDFLKPKPSDAYRHLTHGGSYTVKLNQDESCVALKIYDYGVDTLNEDEKNTLNNLIAKLKDQIHP